MRNMTIQARPEGHMLDMDQYSENRPDMARAFGLTPDELCELASLALNALGADEDLVADLIDQAKDSAADRETEQEQRYDG